VGKFDKKTSIPTFKLSYLVEMRDKGENIVFKGQSYVPEDLIQLQIKSRTNSKKTKDVVESDNSKSSVKSNVKSSVKSTNESTDESTDESSNESSNDRPDNLKTLSYKEFQILWVLEHSRTFGVFYFLVNIGLQCGLLEILEKSFPLCWEQIFSLVMFTLKRFCHYDDCYDWLSQNTSFDNLDEMSVQNIDDLLQSISESDRNYFFKKWLKKISEDEFAFINMRFGSTPETIYLTEHHHQKTFKQINVNYLVGQNTFIPIFQSPYNFNKPNLSKIWATGFKDIVLMEKCLIVKNDDFFGKKNTEAHKNIAYRYLSLVPLTNSWAKKLINKYGKRIINPANIIFINNEDKPIYGMHLKYYNKEAHLFFDPNTLLEEKNKLYTEIMSVIKLLESGIDASEYEEFIRLFINFEKKAGNSQEIEIKANMKSIDNLQRYTGWLVLASNVIDDSQKAFDIYQKSQMFEKGFFKYINVFDFDSLEDSNDVCANNKMFIIFLSLIIDRYVSEIINKEKQLEGYDLEKILSIMEELSAVYNTNGELIVGPVTNEQKTIFRLFKIEKLENICKWDKYKFLK
jgi:hypothetical protein